MINILWDIKCLTTMKLETFRDNSIGAEGAI